MQTEVNGFFPTLWSAVLDDLFPNWSVSLRMFNDPISLWRQKRHKLTRTKNKSYFLLRGEMWYFICFQTGT